MRKFIDIKEKSLFIPIGLHSVTISDVIDYILKAYSTSSSLKKIKEKERKEVENRRRRKRDGKSLCGRKRKGENEM